MNIYVAGYGRCVHEPCLPDVAIDLPWVRLGAAIVLADEAKVTLFSSPKSALLGESGRWGMIRKKLGFSNAELDEKIREVGLKGLEFKVGVLYPVWKFIALPNNPLSPREIRDKIIDGLNEIQELSDKVSRRNRQIEGLREKIKELAKDSEEDY